MQLLHLWIHKVDELPVVTDQSMPLASRRGMVCCLSVCIPHVVFGRVLPPVTEWSWYSTLIFIGSGSSKDWIG